MDISIIVPVFNEEKNIAVLHQRLKVVFDPIGKEYEIIYINDGSTDRSLQVLQEEKDERVIIVNFDVNYGQTAALHAGLRIARGDIILTIDADLQYSPAELLRILKEIEGSDAVIGYRANRNRIEVDGYLKFISSKISNYVRNKVLHENFKDAGCFLRGCKRECVDSLILYDGFQVFFASLLHMSGYRIKEIEVRTYPRLYGKSKYNIRNRFWQSLHALFIVKYLSDYRLAYKIEDIF